MLVGLLWSYFGTTVVGGAIPVLVSLGFLPLLWLPLMATLENVQDMCSAVAAKALRKFEAGKILVQCEIADVTLTILAGGLIIILPSRWMVVVLCVYTAATSFLPLFIDLAEEFYGAEIERRAPGSAAAFNTYLYAAMPAVSQFASTPLGSILAGWSIVAVMGVNVVASVLAIAARYCSLRIGRSVGIGDGADRGPSTVDGDAEGQPGEDTDREELTRVSLSQLVRVKGPGSPLFSAAVPLATGLSAVYVGQWCASFVQDKGPFFAITAICAGIGALIGPFLARMLARTFHASHILYAGCLLTAILMVAGATYAWSVGSPSGTGADASTTTLTFWLYVTLTSLLLAGVGVTQITARQEIFRGDRFVQVMSWGHSLAAAGGLIGVWAGLAMGSAHNPAPALALGAVLLTGTIVLLRPGANGRRSTPREADQQLG